ncbi:Flp family type IVb pilin [Aureimonas ureilytica]|uniref:Flp family type IVb pilin n=1 Tax=Aureimonas ureilytica TaxID=401562 RepID=UPI003CF8B768
MTKLLARFKKNESGATAIEYGLLAALIGVAIIVGAGSLGTTLNSKFSAIATRIGTTATTSPTN